MTHAYALARLLQLGPLDFPQLREITGWKPRQVARTVHGLHRQREVRRVNVGRRYVYELTDLARVPRLEQ